MKKKMCSTQTLQRLPYYLDYLKKNDQKYVSSTLIARELGFHEVQVRKDLALISQRAGLPRKGFERLYLISDLEDFLGFNNRDDAVIIGVGHLGKALLNYQGFKDFGIEIIMGFDNAIKQEKNVAGVRVFPIGKMENLINRLHLKLAIITVPKDEAQKICNRLVSCGVKAIWNFSPVMLKVPDDILVQNENMAASLAMLSKHLSDKEHS